MIFPARGRRAFTVDPTQRRRTRAAATVLAALALLGVLGSGPASALASAVGPPDPAALPWPTSEIPQVEVRAADPGAAAPAHELAAVAPQLVEQVALRLALPAPRHVLVLVASRAPRDEAEALALGVSGVPYWAAGLAEPQRARILLFADRLDLAGHDGLPGALAHEAAHLVLGSNVPGTAEVPRWYDEGLAMLVERDLSWRDAFELARMVVSGDPPPLRELARDWPATGAGARGAYAASLSFVSYLQQGASPGAPRRLVAALRLGANFERAFVIAYGSGTEGSEAAWRGTLGDRYVVLPLVFMGTVANVGLGIFALLALAAGHRRRRRRIAALEDGESRAAPPGAVGPPPDFGEAPFGGDSDPSGEDGPGDAPPPS